jgi:ADP-ribosylglycohydrolase
MVSDDTEHACMTAQALLSSGGDVRRFERSLAWRLRGWLLGLPAGVGMATARATLKLWIGFPPGRSGVWSAGNGPAMRAAVIGAWAAGEDVDLAEFVRASTRLTHTHPAAEDGALVVAMAARTGAAAGTRGLAPASFLASVRPHVTDADLWGRLEIAARCAESAASADEFLAAMELDCGVSGWICHTVPAAVFCWLRWPGDFRTAVEQAVCMGGDADTVGAVTGGMVGATAGGDSIPREWLDGLAEWPRSVDWMRRLAERLARGTEPGRNGSQAALPLMWPALVPRNLLFLAVVLTHGVRRLLPPY